MAVFYTWLCMHYQPDINCQYIQLLRKMYQALLFVIIYINIYIFECNIYMCNCI